MKMVTAPINAACPTGCPAATDCSRMNGSVRPMVSSNYAGGEIALQPPDAEPGAEKEHE